MTLIFQLAILSLMATSSILLISVAIVFAYSDGWSSNKNVPVHHYGLSYYF